MEDKNVRRLKILLLASSLVSLAFLALATWDDVYGGEWRGHQLVYKRALVERADTAARRAAAGAMEVGFRQIYLPELGRVDRCTSCHAGIEDPAMAGAVPPLAAHPGTLLGPHPPERFGCTVCHDGQGRAVSRQAAHGETPFWEEPLLRGELVYTSCGRCHAENDLFGTESDFFVPAQDGRTLWASELEVPPVGGEALERGKRLVIENGCLGCHEYRGMGGGLAPDLSHVGDKKPHDYDFQHLHGARSAYRWQVEHFLDPVGVSPGSFMPVVSQSKDDARSLALYMLALRAKRFPASYTTRALRGEDHPADGEQLFAMLCSACHGPKGAGGVENPNDHRGTVPELDTLAEKMRIFDEEDAESLIERIQAGEDPLAIEQEIFRGWRVTRAQYNSVRELIRNGNPAGKKDPAGPEPPLRMPSWKGKLTDRQIDSIIAYLLGLQPWEDE